MNDIVLDIDVLENAVINLTEGASDEKYAAIWSLEKLLLKKKDQVREFEEELDRQYSLFD
jgi:hypothetical protein